MGFATVSPVGQLVRERLSTCQLFSWFKNTHLSPKFEENSNRPLKGGPLPVVSNYSYKSTYRGYNPIFPFLRPFIGVITPFITGRGPLVEHTPATPGIPKPPNEKNCLMGCWLRVWGLFLGCVGNFLETYKNARQKKQNKSMKGYPYMLHGMGIFTESPTFPLVKMWPFFIFHVYI